MIQKIPEEKPRFFKKAAHLKTSRAIFSLKPAMNHETTGTHKGYHTA